MSTILMILYFCILCANASGYQNIFEATKFSNVSHMSIDNVEIYYHGTSDADSKIRLSDINNMTSSLKSYYSNSQKCIDLSLHVYFVDFDTLNDREVATFVRWKSKSHKIDAIYDATVAPSGQSSIFISTKYDHNKTSKILAHEMAHYWQHTRCISQSEKEAESFSEFYISGKT